MTFTGGTSTGGTSADDGQELTGLFGDVPSDLDSSQISETVEDTEPDAAVAEADPAEPVDPVDPVDDRVQDDPVRATRSTAPTRKEPES